MEKYKQEQKRDRNNNGGELDVRTMRQLEEVTRPVEPRESHEESLDFGEWDAKDEEMSESDWKRLRKISKHAWIWIDGETLGLSMTPDKMLLVWRVRSMLFLFLVLWFFAKVIKIVNVFFGSRRSLRSHSPRKSKIF